MVSSLLMVIQYSSCCCDHHSLVPIPFPSVVWINTNSTFAQSLVRKSTSGPCSSSLREWASSLTPNPKNENNSTLSHLRIGLVFLRVSLLCLPFGLIATYFYLISSDFLLTESILIRTASSYRFVLASLIHGIRGSWPLEYYSGVRDVIPLDVLQLETVTELFRIPDGSVFTQL